MRKFIKYIVVFCVLLLIFNILLFTSSLFPSSLIEKNVRESSKILTEEGNIYQFFDWCSVVNNNYTDVLMINEAYSIDNTNPVYSYMAVRKNYEKGITQRSLMDTGGDSISLNNSEDYDPVGELAEFLDGNIDTSINYARYWHGYLPVIRTLLIFFNISQIRKILLIIFIIIFVWLLVLIRKEIGVAETIIFGISLILQGYFFVSYSLESSPVFLVMMISSIILLKRINRIKNLYLYFFIISCITNFVDYLTVPLITLGIPLILYILYKQKNDNTIKSKDYIKIIIKSSIVWFIGYAFTWGSKWIIYDILYNQGVIKSAIFQVIYRAESTNNCKGIKIYEVVQGFMLENMGYCFILGILTLVILLVRKNKYNIKLKNGEEYFNQIKPILIILIMPLVWYFVLANHTIIHTRFTYRHMLIFLIGILVCLKNTCTVEKLK